MSTSLNVVNMAAFCCASTNRLAHHLHSMPLQQVQDLRLLDYSAQDCWQAQAPSLYLQA
jgi:hypothetical protein